MSTLEVLGTATLVELHDDLGPLFGLIERGNPLVAVAVHVTADRYCEYWRFFAAKSGVELVVWDERPGTPDRQSKAAIPRYTPQLFGPHLFEDARQLAASAIAAGLTLENPSPDAARVALAAVTFAVPPDGGAIVCHRELPKYLRPRRQTQKRLDGSEDMTV